MKREKALLNVIYGYIALAFVAIVVDAAGLLHPLPDILAGIWLLVACWYIGRYGATK